MPEPRVFEGELWVRLMNRGVELTDAEGRFVNLDDWLAEALGIEPYFEQGGARVRLTLEILEDVEKG